MHYFNTEVHYLGHVVSKEGIVVDSKKISVMKPAHKEIEKIDQCLRIQPLRGGNLLYITQMNDSLMIQMTKPPFYI